MRDDAADNFVAAVGEEDGLEVTITQNEYRDASWVPASYSELMKTNDYRELLLDDARRYSPISSVFHLNKIKQTVVYRILFFPLAWILFSTYGVCAALTRYGVIDLGHVDDELEPAFAGAEVLVTFVVVFYLGYCYARYFEIYHLATAAKSTIVSLCAASRACLPINARRKLFVHLNLMHASAYCALTPIYNFDNFMETFCKLHHIEVPDHQKHFGDVDTGGGVHYNQCAVWAQTVLHKALVAGECHPEAFRNMQEEVLKLRQLFSTIFAYQYQVIPFAYSHLVSFGCFVYLFGLAVAKAVRFQPEADYLGGLFLPCLSFSILTIIAIGLIEIGQAISDPWGNDPEDFAVPRFLHATAKMTRHLIEGEHDDPLDVSQTVDVGSPELQHVPLEGQSRMRRHASPEPHHHGALGGLGAIHQHGHGQRRHSFHAFGGGAAHLDVGRRRRDSLMRIPGGTSNSLLAGLGIASKEQKAQRKVAAAKIQALARGRATRKSVPTPVTAESANGTTLSA